MPLAWAHAEYIKLRRSLRDGVVFDMPAQTVQRYLKQQTGSDLAIWRFNHKCQSMAVGRILRIEVLAPVVVHWSSDGWQTSHDANTVDTGLGMHVVDLPTDDLLAGTELTFTLYWPTEDRWEGTDFEVRIES
jgi:glucoamylase